MNKHMFHKWAVVTISTGIGLGTFGISSASAFQLFTDRTAWENALGSSITVTETFENPISGASRIVFDGGIVSEGIDGTSFDPAFDNAVANGIYSANLDTDEDSPISDFFNEINWTFPEAVFAVGGDFLLSTNSEVLQIFGDFDGNGEEVVDLGDVIGVNTDGFLGIIGEASFNSVTYRSRTDDRIPTELEDIVDDTDLETIIIDNFSTASATVPEPTSIMGFLALGILGVLKYKQR
ncbi:MAG: PEP-CTERM sorting domain-containing protein [Cyanobacteria bacterium P01_A01_bin.123]